MKYRYLRIAWSVGWGVICLLLCMPAAMAANVHNGKNESITVAFQDCALGDVLRVLASSQQFEVDTLNVTPQKLQQSLTLSYRGSVDGLLNRLSADTGLNFTLGPATKNGSKGLLAVYESRPWSKRVWLLLGCSLIVLLALYASRRRLRFSLRTLLIATTLVAVALGLLVMMSRGS